MTHFLGQEGLALMRGYRNYGKVCCFKGFDQRSFAFNTGASPELFDRQFEIYRKHLGLGLDLYAYVTFTSPIGENIGAAMREFIDRLQSLHPKLPLRTIPLEIRNFTPMEQRRLQSTHEDAIRNQQTAVRFWNDEIEKRFSSADRSLPIYAVQ